MKRMSAYSGTLNFYWQLIDGALGQLVSPSLSGHVSHGEAMDVNSTRHIITRLEASSLHISQVCKL